MRATPFHDVCVSMLESRERAICSPQCPDLKPVSHDGQTRHSLQLIISRIHTSEIASCPGSVTSRMVSGVEYRELYVLAI